MVALLVLPLLESGGASLVVTPTDQSFSAAQTLTLLVTMESLLFAAFNVALALSVPVVDGRNISKQGAYRLANVAVAALTIIAAGAVMAWWQVFVDHWPRSNLRWLEATAVVIGISAQPLVSFRAARGIKP